jgi:predicted DNA-binding transcriptional regulator YafY
MGFSRYIGRSVEIIYMDRTRRCTKRTVTVHRVSGQLLFGYDHEKRAFRTFRVDQILAMLPVSA